ncbi:39S ribosomal protein L17, mitochondrial [Marmota marmota marmota]|uniref:Large ribosomal subunit protein bL17m n=3 Tax=Marmota marmota marmota TaxID=9994 RepID=A0A8C5ZNZ6_MARMA|nr:39S ribosomal protein L17, mitochondrial [Marmota marmota marmota]XP_027775740.1 39S ribosomal protein L17, mitochondrial [Marmota flaviventris]
MRLSVSAAISHGRVFRRLGLGPESRIHLLRNLLTGLVRHERIEASWARVDEMRGYAEKLIDYGKLGDTNERAMRMADFWLTEKDLIPKLFQVLAPRFQDQNGGYTRMLRIPNSSQQDRAKMAVIEYKGNCLPPLPLPRRDSNLTLLNQLLQGLRQDLHQNQEASLSSSHTAQPPRI